MLAGNPANAAAVVPAARDKNLRRSMLMAIPLNAVQTNRNSLCISANTFQCRKLGGSILNQRKFKNSKWSKIDMAN
jgi:hypothetical protein